jgi:hypothetical protein
MDTRQLFQKISDRMRADFDASAQIKHSGSKGTVRENTLRKFLEVRLPAKYALGAGEIVGRVRNTTSRQCDLIVFDRQNGVTLLYDETIQVFPVDCVYGIIEVKSALSKTEFLDALEKIKVLKSMTPGGPVSLPIAGGFAFIHARPQPFGMVFAYGLGDNSLESLLENLREWEAVTPAAFWPNYVCILEIGVIFHFSSASMENCIDSSKIVPEAWPMYISYGKDSLFQFYSALHDVGARMQLGPVELGHYYDPAVQIGKHVVYGRGFEGLLTKAGTASGRPVRLKESTIDRVIEWCSTQEPVRYETVLLKQFGMIPQGMENLRVLDLEVYIYNPDNLPGLHEIGKNPITMVGNRPSIAPSLATAFTLDIDGQRYVIAGHGFTEDDWEDAHVPGIG